MNIHEIVELIKACTVPCSDDGVRFTDSTRLDYIINVLSSSRYTLIEPAPPLARIYKHELFDEDKPFLLLSCHIDSIYNTHWLYSSEEEIRGTLDNSACTGILLYSMQNDLLDPQVVISFTGNEESDSIGVDQTVEFLQRTNIWHNLQLVIVLDLTEECYDRACTVENIFPGEHHSTIFASRLQDLETFQNILKNFISDFVIIEEGDPDDSWQYDEHDLNVFSLCLPCRVLGDDMHDDQGLSIKLDSINEYTHSLIKLTKGLIGTITQASNDTSLTVEGNHIQNSSKSSKTIGFREFLHRLRPINRSEIREWIEVLIEYDEEFSSREPTLLWYLSSGFDLRALVHLNEKDTSEVYKSPTVDFFIYSDYSLWYHGYISCCYNSLDYGEVILFRDSRTQITLDQAIPLAFMASSEIDLINDLSLGNKVDLISSTFAYYCLITIESNYFGEEYFPLIFMPMDNWVLMRRLWRPYNVRFNYICGVCDGCQGGGGARIGPDSKPMCVNQYYKDFLGVMRKDAYWISDHIHRCLPSGFHKVATFKGWGPYSEKNESYMYRVDITE